MFSRGNYDIHSNKGQSDFSERSLITKTNECMQCTTPAAGWR